MNKRPLAVTLIGCVYLLVGVVGFVFHLRELVSRDTFGYDAVLIELSELLAFLFGVFLLQGQNWARWGVLAWMAFHVLLSVFHALREFIVHALILAIIAWFLFRPETSRYFSRHSQDLM